MQSIRTDDFINSSLIQNTELAHKFGERAAGIVHYAQLKPGLTIAALARNFVVPNGQASRGR